MELRDALPITEDDIAAKLNRFNVTQTELFDVAHKATVVRNNSVQNDPINAPGQLAYIYGTRSLRELLLSKGWTIDRTNNIEGSLSPDKTIKVVYQNTDTAANPSRIPKAISSKGPASDRIVAQWQQTDLFPTKPEEAQKDPEIWYLCVSSSGNNIQAELSCPTAIIGGQFAEFSDRIFIITDTESSQFITKPVEMEDAAFDEESFKINITPK